MARQSGPEFFGEFETEHNFSREVFKDPARAAILRQLGFQQDMAGNRRSLFTSSDITTQLGDAADNQAYKKVLNETGWGTVLHRGGDTEVGGFQEGKNAFQIDKIDKWIARSQLAPGEPGYITADGLKYAIDDLHKFGADLATGKIKRAD